MFIKICKFFVGIYLLYNMWYSQIWGANQLFLYVSVGFSIFFMFLDAVFVMKKFNIGKINPIIAMYIVYGVYAILTGMIVSIDKHEFFSSVFTYISFTLVVFVFWYISFRTQKTKWILDLIYVLALLCALTTIFNGQPYNNGVIVTTMGEYNNPNTLGVLMVFGIFATVIQKESFEKHFVLKYTSIFAFLYVILLTGSRKALFAGIGLFIFWLIEYFIEKKKERLSLKSLAIIMTVLLSVLGAMGYVVNIYVGTSGFERLLMFFEEGGTSTRLQLMDMAVQYWKTSPIFGIGLDQFKILNPYGYYSHSTYAEILACTGIIGCLLFFIPLIKILLIAVKKSFRHRADLYKMRVCLLMLGVELFLGIGQIFIYSISHMLILFFIANVVYEDIGFHDQEKCPICDLS